MKKQQNNSTRAWALHVALSLALLSISAVLLASSFKAAPAARGLNAPINPVGAGSKDLMIAGPASSQSLSPADAPFTFGNTGSLNTARSRHTATLLPNGKVLVAGGFEGGVGALSSAELYDPASGTWSATGSLTTARAYHTATLLPNGKVLVVGGTPDPDFFGVVFSSAELYDPASGTWTTQPFIGSLHTARELHTATLLPNGKVLVAGGDDGSGNSLTSAELYDPALGNWTPTGSLTTARNIHTATLLGGAVLVAGGDNGGGPLSSVEVYIPASGTWFAIGSLHTARELHTATLLPNGKVLVAGGDNGGPLNSAELYDPASGAWTVTGSLNTARAYHTATLLPNGKVLVPGGVGNGILSSAELYDPASGTWSATGNLITPRMFHTATLLPNGRVLVAGGYDGITGSLSSAELYDPGTITVTNTNDSGPGSLRQAVADANDGDTINFALTYPATITLTSGQLVVGSSVTISGPGADQLSVNGNHSSSVFYITSGKTVTISGLTITNGNATGGNGGGIYNDQATLTVTNSTLSSNSAGGGGGGIYNNVGTLMVTNSALSGNSGGGIYNNVGTLIVTNSTLSSNSGGGIFNFSVWPGNATVSVSASTLSGNSGVAISISNTGVCFPIVGCQFGTSALEIGDTILNAGPSGINISNSQGTVTSHGYNLSSDLGGGFLTATGDQLSTDPLLGPLQDNGGPTFTHELLPGSPAINMGNPTFTPPPNYDQRGPGFDRVRNGRIDIGAFEVQAAATPTATPTATATAPFTPTAEPTATFTPTPTATATFTPTATATATATFTPTPTPTPCDGINFTNPVPIVIPDRSVGGTPAPAALYPSSIMVAGMQGSVTKVTVKLNNITHGNPADLDMMLVGPSGQAAFIMSDAGGCWNWYH